jgi:hypothetical protein
MNQVFEMINQIEEHERMKANDQNINQQEPKPFIIKRIKNKIQDESKPVEEEKPKKKLGRPKTEWRHREDGIYDGRAIDPDYAKKYWR